MAKDQHGKEYNTGRPGGRPGRLNPVTATSLINSISGGAYISTACQFTGIGLSTYQLWRRRGETEVERVRTSGKDPDAILQYAMVDSEGKTLSVAQMMNQPAPTGFHAREWSYVCFYMHSEKAMAVSEIRNLTIIQKAAGDGNWQAGAWILERTRPSKFGRRERINLEGSTDGDPISIKNVGIEDVEAAIRKLKGNG